MELCEARFKKRMAQWDLTTLTGISQSKISLIERGRIEAKTQDKILISKALSVDVGQIEWKTLPSTRISLEDV